MEADGGLTGERARPVVLVGGATDEELSVSLGHEVEAAEGVFEAFFVGHLVVVMRVSNLGNGAKEVDDFLLLVDGGL